MAVGSQNVFPYACPPLLAPPAGPIIVRRPGLHRKKSQLGFPKAADRDAAAVAAAAAAVLAVAPPETWLIPAVLDPMRTNAAAQQAQEAASCPASPVARPTPDLECSAAFAAAVNAAAAKLRLSLGLELSPDEVRTGWELFACLYDGTACGDEGAVHSLPSATPQPPLNHPPRSPRSFPPQAQWLVQAPALPESPEPVPSPAPALEQPAVATSPRASQHAPAAPAATTTKRPIASPLASLRRGLHRLAGRMRRGLAAAACMARPATL